MGATGSKVDVTPALVEALVEEYKSAGGITEANTTAGCEFLNPECPPFLRSYLSKGETTSFNGSLPPLLDAGMK